MNDNKDNYECNVCGKVVKTKKSLARHMYDIHNPERMYRCNVGECQKTFKRAYLLVNHIKTHTTQRIFTCDIDGCSKSFALEQYLKRHIVTRHNDAKFVCDEGDCQKSFKTSTDLKEHQKSHSDEKQFVCSYDECNKSYKSRTSLMRHIKSNHKDIRPFECNSCDKAFHSKSQLEKHQLVHVHDRKYECDLCEFTCKHKDYLVQHMKSHSDERPFVCQICNHSSKTKSHLRIHMTRHSNERPFQCNVNGCNYSAKTSGDMRQHLSGPHDIGTNICDNCQEPHQSSIKHPDHTLSDYKVCKDCYREITGEPYRVECVVSKYLDECKDISEKLISSDMAMKTIYGCSLKRPDKLYINMDNKVIVIVEVDEYQHTRSSDYRCDEARLTEIYDEFEHYRDYHMIVIRFNPDSYNVRDNEKETLFEDRLIVLQDTLWNFLVSQHGLEEHEKIFVYYMYYDDDSDIIVENIPHFMFQ